MNCVHLFLFLWRNVLTILHIITCKSDLKYPPTCLNLYSYDSPFNFNNWIVKYKLLTSFCNVDFFLGLLVSVCPTAFVHLPQHQRLHTLGDFHQTTEWQWHAIAVGNSRRILLVQQLEAGEEEKSENASA